MWNIYFKHKEQQQILHQYGVVYETSCNCGSSYIGQTSRNLITRINNHDPSSKHHRIDLKTQLQTNLELFHLLLLHVNKSKTSVEAKTKKRHDKKLEKLRFGQSSNQSKQVCRDQHIKQKWVHNLSSKSLTHTQTGVLEKGFNFALSPKSLPMVDIICGVEEGLRKVNDAAAVSTARSKVAGVLKTARLPKRNIDKEKP